MKQFLLFLALVPFLTACPPSRNKREDSVKAFSQNNYNLKPSRKSYYRNISFQLPEVFEQDYSKQHVYRSSAATYVEYQLGINFTVERFLESDLFSELMAGQVIKSDLLNGFHDAYISRRINSLEGGISTYKKKVYNPLKLTGVIQTVSFENENDYDQELYYATATMKVENEYYIFQFIAEKSMMAYLHDDFERILSSVRKLK